MVPILSRKTALDCLNGPIPAVARNFLTKFTLLVSEVCSMDIRRRHSRAHGSSKSRVPTSKGAVFWVCPGPLLVPKKEQTLSNCWTSRGVSLLGNACASLTNCRSKYQRSLHASREGIMHTSGKMRTFYRHFRLPGEWRSEQC